MNIRISVQCVWVCVILLCAATNAFAQDGGKPKKDLFIIVPGANPGLNPKGKYSDIVNSPQTSYQIYNFKKEDMGFKKYADQFNQALNGPFNNVFIEIRIDYPSTLSYLEPAYEIVLEDVPPELSEQIPFIAQETSEVIKAFRKAYPQGEVFFEAVATGNEIVNDIVRAEAPTKMFVTYPTMHIVNDNALFATLKSRGFNRDRLVMLAMKGDPTIPALEKRYDADEALFQLLVMSPR